MYKHKYTYKHIYTYMYTHNYKHICMDTNITNTPISRQTPKAFLIKTHPTEDYRDLQSLKITVAVLQLACW